MMATLVDFESTADPPFEEFCSVASRAHADDPVWAPASEEAVAWAFREAELGGTPLRAFVAIRAGSPVARGTALRRPGNVGWIGLVEWVPGDEVAARSVLDACESTLVEWGAETAEAPCSDPLTIGLQVGGFELPHTVFTTHHRPDDLRLFQSCGFEVRRRMVAPLMTRERAEAMTWGAPAEGVTVRHLDVGRLDDEARVLAEMQSALFETASNRPPTANSRLLERLLAHVDPELVLIAEVDGRPVGNLVCLPDSWQSPGPIDRARILSVGVRDPHRRVGIGSAMGAVLAEVLLAKGYQSVEGVWVREDNEPPQHLAQRFGGQIGRTFVVLGKRL